MCLVCLGFGVHWSRSSSAGWLPGVQSALLEWAESTDGGPAHPGPVRLSWRGDAESRSGHRKSENCREIRLPDLFTCCLLLEASRNPEWVRVRSDL